MFQPFSEQEGGKKAGFFYETRGKTALFITYIRPIRARQNALIF